jgi:DNA-binding transcriptional regulator YhcF (GntR family)
MVFHVRPDSPVPIYEQITAQVIFGVAAGDPPPGDLVPSVRDLAQRLLVNPNTVARAYQDLERMGILESRRGRGMEVTDTAPEVCDTRRREMVRERIRDALRAAAAGGLEAEDVHSLVDEEWRRVNGRARRRGREERA